MKGNWFYVALAALLGTLAAFFQSIIVGLAIVFSYFIWLITKRIDPKVLIVCTLVFVLFSLNFKFVDDKNNSTLTVNDKHFSGVITSIPQFDGNQMSFFYQLPTKEKLQVFYQIKNEEELQSLHSLHIGMSCRFTGHLNEPRTARNFYAFDYKQYLFHKHIHWTLTPNRILPSQCSAVESNHYLLQKWRSNQLSFIKENFPEKTVGIVQALIFGERDEISLIVLDHFQKFGIIHLLAISGLHVGLVVAASYYVLIRIGVTREDSFNILLLSLPLYIVITGAAPSVVRACLMTLLFLLSLKFKAKISPLDALSLAFLIMIAINPYYIFEIGFQLSFLVSFALIVSAAFIFSLYESRIQQLLAVTMVAQLVSVPLLLYYFYEISLLSLPLNIIFVPFISLIILPLSFIAYFAYILFEPIGVIITMALAVILDASYFFLEVVDNYVPLTLRFGKPRVWLLALYYGVIIFFLLGWEKHKRISKLKREILLLLFLFLYHWWSPHMSSNGLLTMIDVGQGDSILIELPYRKGVYLIDTGGRTSFEQQDWEKQEKSFDIGEDIVTPYLKARGIRTINKLVLTHGDADHIGGARSVINYVKVNEVVIGLGEIDNEEKQLYKYFKDQNIPITQVKNGNGWAIENYQFYVLSPYGDEKSKNNRSVVIYTILGGYKWLFTGDLEEKGESRLLTQFPNLTVDVLKVGHHGSKTSSSKSFIERLSPKYALLSVGESNRFGHPHSEIINLLKGQHTQILRTDKHGAICFTFNENQGTFTRKLP
ncbi:DNA internalization-related competence protein ComEC/Rec2 [Calidifontibacillus oryziterrae]|uniref:DNA internalization-related competence protein ComEC/Rec2 n=1 Tax=Calidifontibacillus oryziterrae TaxID=1191699 RepID=UPI00031D10B6|nr:DNA internalization-related competence protein ComEC/Rec2 [Calidifontibacillus oryziterrae]